MAPASDAALLLLATACNLVVLVSGDFDLLKPIVKLSPDMQNAGDHFGYTAIAHQLFSNSTGMSFEEILQSTVIISGAPYGIYPGGLDLPLDWRACQLDHRPTTCAAYNTLLANYTDGQIEDCYQTLRSGLVYSCSLTSGECGSLMNGTVLFDSIGNYYDNCDHDNKPSKTNQLMGSFLYSNGDYFVACAQLQRFETYFNGILDVVIPVGSCVIINRNLTEIMNQYSPCDTFADGISQSSQGFCTSGISSVMIDRELIMGAPTTDGVGRVEYFPNIASNTPSMPPYPRPNSSKSDEYLGYSVVTGNITGNSEPNVIASQPSYRDNNGSPIGRVIIYEQRMVDQTLTGFQGGEYFGYSVAAIDLNGDSWDDLLVGAPFYTRFTSPIQVSVGRVFIFTRQANGSLTQSGILTGAARNGQFGTAIANVGDLNNDGYEDFAVSAPFEGSGVVYIYYGQAMDQQGYIVNTTVQQRIDGSSLVNQVFNLTSVSSFGFSLSGNVDVDQNEYRDLVIGAFESQAVFVLRSIPIAVATISISTNVSEVRLDSYQCNYNGMPISCFEITVCSQYTGKGLQGGFSTTYELREVTAAGQTSRLFFTSPTSNSMTRNITYPSVGTTVCSNITVYVQNTTDISDFKLRADVNGVIRDNTPVSTNTFPIDLSGTPDISTVPGNIALRVATECGDDKICDSDLNLVVSKVTYRDHQIMMTTDQSQYVIGNASIVDLTLMISNTAEDAFQPYISLDVSQTYFTGVQSLNASIRCNATSQNGTISTYTCTGIKTPFTRLDGVVPIVLRLQANSSLTGNEPPVDIPVSVNIPLQTRNRENASFSEDNTDSVRIPFIATLSYTINVFYQSASSINYFGNGTNNVNGIASNLGERLNMLMILRNNGPSPYTGTLSLYIPARNREETGSYYYYYPVELTVTDSGGSTVQCDQSSLNPDNYNTAEETTRRNRRSLAKRGYSDAIRKRQAIVYNLDCQATPNMCIKVQCNVTDLRRSTVAARVRGYIDERFFQGKTETYNFVAFAEGNVNDGFTSSNGSERQATAKIAYTRLIIVPGDTGGDFPYIYLIIPIVFAIIFIIILAVALYCLGFFKRRKTKKEQEEMDPYEDGYDPQNDDEVKDPKEFGTTL